MQMAMQEFFVRNMVNKFRSPNFDCFIGYDELPLEEPTNFGYDFEAKGEIKFMFLTAASFVT